MARSFDVHHGPPPQDVMAIGQQWLSAKLNRELDVLSNLIYLAGPEPDRRDRYLKIAEAAIARIRKMSQECRSFKTA